MGWKKTVLDHQFLVFSSQFQCPLVLASDNFQCQPENSTSCRSAGLGEFGMNCMAVRWGDDIVVIDAGLMFPEAELLGVDIVVPEISYLTKTGSLSAGLF